MAKPRFETENQKKDRNLRANINHAMEMQGFKNRSELADRLAMSRSTLCSKLQNPNRFTLNDLRKLIYVLHLSDDEVCEFI